MRRAVESVKRDPGFYSGQVGVSLWNYAQIAFNPNSRASSDYEEDVSRAGSKSACSEVVFLAVFVAALTAQFARAQRCLSSTRFVWHGGGASPLGHGWYITSCHPGSGIVPISIGLVFFLWRAGRKELAAWKDVFKTCGAWSCQLLLAGAVFANAAIFFVLALMTDWLFLFYFFAAIWFPVEVLW